MTLSITYNKPLYLKTRVEELLAESPVNEIFILRKETESKIDKNTVYDFFGEVKNALKKIKSPAIKQPPGRLLHPE